MLINTKYYCESVEIKTSDYSFLDHDSHIGCNLFKYPAEKYIDPSWKKGHLTKETVGELKKTIPEENTLTPEQQELILTYLDKIK